jgi:hypothetical protein
MKFTILLPAILSFVALPLQAFGPAPFRNGSPLASGTDGIYQAVATASNVTGLFSWAISGGTQTSDPQNNKWVFFVDGQLLSGTTAANVSDGKIAGVLDSGITTGVPTQGNGTNITPPVVFVIPGNAGSGQFQGKINLKSPNASFNGTGRIEGTPLRVDQIVYIAEIPSNLFILENFTPVIVEPVIIPGSALPATEFTFRGTRLSLGTPTASQTPAIQN